MTEDQTRLGEKLQTIMEEVGKSKKKAVKQTQTKRSRVQAKGQIDRKHERGYRYIDTSIPPFYNEFQLKAKMKTAFENGTFMPPLQNTIPSEDTGSPYAQYPPDSSRITTSMLHVRAYITIVSGYRIY